MNAAWRDVTRLLRHPMCRGAGPIQLLAKEDFYDEDDLPFLYAGTGVAAHIIPDPGFRKENLAATEDERLLIVDCPDAPGWLVPDDLVANWLARHVACPDLEDLLVSHPLYEYLTTLDDEGRSRGGHRGGLLQWAPGVPNLASVYAPEFLPDDEGAPQVNRDRDAYADAVLDLLEQLDSAFPLLEVELGLRFGEAGALVEADDALPGPGDGRDRDA